jgi:triacylglycerol lipase
MIHPMRSSAARWSLHHPQDTKSRPSERGLRKVDHPESCKACSLDASKERTAMSKIPYDRSYRSLFFPGEADDFFSFGTIMSDAALCAEMSRLAYVTDEKRLKTYLERIDFTLMHTVGYNKPGMQVFVATSNHDVDPITIAAFRGTEVGDPTDLFADVRFWKVGWHGAGKVHDGFRDELARFSEVRDRGSLIPAGTRSLFTGHSLGAAFATLAAALHVPDYLYTFGSPRVGDRDFANSMQAVNHARYVDCCDLVAKVPPTELIGIELGYEHVGLLHYIDRRGAVMLSPSAELIDDDQREASWTYDKYAVVKGNVPARTLADHTAINYVSAVMGLRA